MSDRDEVPADGETSGSRFHIPQANRDLQSNWELDLAKNLEEYLLKICSGEASSDQESSINFAEAALLLQGSVQVYSRKVEYLHSLVLAALEFLSQKRQNQQEKTSASHDESDSRLVIDDEDEVFIGLDDVPVEPKNCLDQGIDKEENSNYFLKPPSNLLVLEGDCLDSSGDGSELESYLLATCNFYRDFLLLDPSDAGAVCKFLNANGVGDEQPTTHKGSFLRSKHRRSEFVSPTGKSGGAPHKSGGRNHDAMPNATAESNHECNNEHISGNQCFSPSAGYNFPVDEMHHEEENIGVFDNNEDNSDSESEDPWKPLNPHEPGNLKIKPFKASKTVRRQVTHNSRPTSIASQFPIAKMDGVISPELAESYEVKLRLQEKESVSQSPPLFEKLRRSFTSGGEESFDAFGGIEDENCDNGMDDLDDIEHTDFDLPNNMYDMDTELSPGHHKRDYGGNFGGTDVFPEDDPSSQVSLEDLCRSHLDALLASIAETEQQTELATQVSTWKQRIEETLDEQDNHSPFDIHQYGEIVLDKLSSETDNGGIMSFTDVVKGQPKHDIARTFSALLQLVNNGDVDLQRAPASGELICYTGDNPFSIKLLHNNRRKEAMATCSSRKRVKSPSKRLTSRATSQTQGVISVSKPPQPNGKVSVKLGKSSVIRCTPEGKRRRRSRIAETVDVQPTG